MKWKDRTCKTCEFHEGGRCHYHAPGLSINNARRYDHYDALWPRTAPDDFCGQHEARDKPQEAVETIQPRLQRAGKVIKAVFVSDEPRIYDKVVGG